MSDEEIINKFVEAGFPISKMIVYTEETLGNFVCFLGSGSEAVTGSEVSEASVVVSASFLFCLSFFFYTFIFCFITFFFLILPQ